MHTDLEMILAEIPRSDTVEMDIRDRVDKVEKHSDKLIRCRVHLQLQHCDQQLNEMSQKLTAHGVIERMDYTEDHGFIRTTDERRIYFHSTSVLDNMFYSLEPGSEVRFVEREGDQALQASSVYVLGTYQAV